MKLDDTCCLYPQVTGKCMIDTVFMSVFSNFLFNFLNTGFSTVKNLREFFFQQLTE